MSHLAQHDSELFTILEKEINREESTLELIASENFTSQAVMEMAGGVMTNKYAEGYPGKRYYGGCEFVDEAENLARTRLGELFNAEYTNVQPHSGSQANMAALMTFLNPGDTVLGLDLSHGGHLTHGSPVNFSGQLYNFISYHVSKETGRVDFDEVAQLAKEFQPKLIICGGSAYPRFIEFEQFREIADLVGAYLMADIAHPSGLVASGLHPSPMPFCDVVTSTTHKTLRGPRGGIIMMGKDFENPWGKVAPKSGRVKKVSELLDSMVMPGIQGGPLMHIIAAKGVAFGEALKPEFKSYTKKIIENAKVMADEFLKLDYQLVSGGTDTHLVLVDLSNKNITGKLAELSLGKAGITVNKNMVPFDERSPFVTSGIRVGTPAVTTRGMGKLEIQQIVKWIDQVISDSENEENFSRIRLDIKTMCSSFPIYKNI
ncbi:MAG: serine hydroxymethyltransferase [Candidatus Marinimicrobia bacterium]|mgnify:CR=1 FL=1|jgi:glycine hydroxymethyltransferase|nr:serine hydroxymethyltransferase [Candidatus Neomarinimicrobiota bacterium]MBT3502339.1 serine hydroxymethyltransferase [Candidatus Neomarinimicrobiota bacterium]MBT3840379.1 serine hydroxymethyltransferase [Candidatus Neomarinimicrobiota bacterium]MBT3999444.1 serine hydroxymethyltransferase [Candidatus Neomarinimicrobiota bacterium]MBT4282037.1 serine hydroxymethyltransferase [Candidatus Neomarinimicrobiota bacterium]